MCFYIPTLSQFSALISILWKTKTLSQVLWDKLFPTECRQNETALKVTAKQDQLEISLSVTAVMLTFASAIL